MSVTVDICCMFAHLTNHPLPWGVLALFRILGIQCTRERKLSFVRPRRWWRGMGEEHDRTGLRARVAKFRTP